MTGIGAILLAGGRAERLGGGDKPLLELDGRSILQRTVDAARAAGVTSIVISGPESVAIDGTRRVREDPPFTGPTAAVVAALDSIPPAADPEWTLLLACDLEHPDAAVDRLVADLATLPTTSDGLCLADASARPQWLTGIYRTAALRRAALALPDSGRNAPIRRLLDGLSIVVKTVADDVVRDIDTVEDLNAARRRAALKEHAS